MAEALRSGASARNTEVVLQRPDGGRIAVLVNVDPLRDDSGAVVGAINCFQQIGGPVPGNGILDQQQQRFRELLEALPVAIYTTDQEGRITFYNQGAAALWGHRPPLGEGQWCGSWRLYWPDGEPMAHDACPMAVALKSGQPIRGAEAIAERPNGTRVPFMAFPTPLRDASGKPSGAVNMLVDITERKAAEATLRENDSRMRLLVREVDHRAKNMLATVQAIARMTSADTVPAFADAFLGRLLALSHAHSLLSESRWAGADLQRLVEQELRAYGIGEGGRIRLAGPKLTLSAEAAQVLAMSLHELATNAAKYGALSARDGRVAVSWRWDDAGRLLLRWQECGGPPVRAPSRRGFGTGLINIAVSGQLEGDMKLSWLPEGLVCEIALPASRLAPGEAETAAALMD